LKNPPGCGVSFLPWIATAANCVGWALWGFFEPVSKSKTI